MNNEHINIIKRSDEIAKHFTECLNFIRGKSYLPFDEAYGMFLSLLYLYISSDDREINTLTELSNQKSFYNENELSHICNRILEDIQTRHNYSPTENFILIRLNNKIISFVFSFLDKIKEDLSNSYLRGRAFNNFLLSAFRGQYAMNFTPYPIVAYMIEIINPRIGEKIYDPCCGSGSFLTESFNHVVIKNPDKNYIDKNVFTNDLLGMDISKVSINTARLNMLLYTEREGNIFYRNFLSKNWSQEEQYDVIFAHPPFGTKIDKHQMYDLQLTGISNRIELIFLEQCLKFLKPNGRMGIILPDYVLGNRKFEEFRKFIERESQILNITSLPKDVYMALGIPNHNSSIIFLRKYKNEEKTNIQTFKKGKKAYTKFDYEIPIYKIDKAGINSIGKPDKNQLIDASKHYQDFIKESTSQL